MPVEGSAVPARAESIWEVFSEERSFGGRLVSEAGGRNVQADWELVKTA